METGFNPGIRAAGLVASLRARGAGFDAAVSNPRHRFALSQATRKGFAGSTSRPVEFLFRSTMSDPKKTKREFRSRTWAHFFRGRGDENIHCSVPARAFQTHYFAPSFSGESVTAETDFITSLVKKNLPAVGTIMI